MLMTICKNAYPLKFFKLRNLKTNKNTQQTMKKLILALILLTGCKKQEPKFYTPRYPEPYKPCPTKLYGGYYKSVGYTGINYPFTDTMRLIMVSDSAKLTFAMQTSVNDTVIYFTCKVGCGDESLPCQWETLTHHLVMKDTVTDYIISNGTDSLGTKRYIRFKK